MLTVYTMDQREAWDAVVRSFQRYDVYYLSGYVKAFQLHGDGTPLLLCYSAGPLRGMNVVMKRDIASDSRFRESIRPGECFDIATPYGYGGWYFEGDQRAPDMAAFREEYLEWCRANHIVSEFVRFHPILGNASGINQDTYEITPLGNTVAIELDSEDGLWERFSSKNRGHIRKAIKSGVTVDYSCGEAAFDTFMAIYGSTMQRDEAVDYYYFDKPFYDSIREDLRDHALLFTARLEEQPIAAAIMLFADKCMNYHLSGQLFEYRKYAGTSLILYEAAKWGCRNGYSTLHLGGGVGAQPGPLYEYKKSFNDKGEDYHFHIGKKVFMQDAYEDLCRKRGLENTDQGFFPAYRK